jgi:hypothetical protein
MEQKNNLISGLLSSSSDYIQLQSKSIRLGFYQKTTDALTGAVQWVIIAVLGVITYLFLNIGIAFVLGTITGSLIMGFFIMGGFNLLLLIIYSFTKKSLGKKKLQNSILQSVSGTMHDYEELVKQHSALQSELQVAEKNLRQSAEDVRVKLTSLEQQVDTLRGQLTGSNGEGNSLARTALTTGIDLLLNVSFLKNAGIVKRALVPVLTNVLVSSRLFNEKKKNGLLEKLRLKMHKMLK